MQEAPRPEVQKSAAEYLRELGFSELAADVMQVAVRLGARRVMALHGASAEELQTTYKASEAMSAVTVADKESGDVMRKLVGRKFPNDSINEEETGLHEGNERTWYMDPLDGTGSFVREQNYSSIGTAVYENGEPKAAAICQPFERELIVAEAGKGAFIFQLDEHLAIIGQPTKLEVSSRKSLKGGMVYMDAHFNDKTAPRKLATMEKLVALSGNRLGFRMTGSNIDQQRQVATGRAEATITDAVGGFWDLAAGALIIKEAGGEFCDAQGKPVNEKTQIAVGGNKEIVASIIPILSETYKDYAGHK